MASAVRDVVIEISAEVVEKIVLQRLRSASQSACIDLSTPNGMLFAALFGLTGQTLTHFGFWPIAARLSQTSPTAMSPGGDPVITIDFAFPPQLDRNGARVRQLVLDLDDVLAMAGGAAQLVPSSVLSLIGATGTPTVETRVVAQGTVLAIGIDVPGGISARTGWNTFDEDFLDGRDWGVQIDDVIVRQFVQQRLDQFRELTLHEGGGKPSGFSLVRRVRLIEGQWIETIDSSYPANGIREEDGVIHYDRAWDAIAAGRFGGSGEPSDVAFYSKRSGRLEVNAYRQGRVVTRHVSEVGEGWDVMLVGQWNPWRIGDLGPFDDLLFYRRADGKARIYNGRSDGSFVLVRELELEVDLQVVVIANRVVTFDREERRTRTYAIADNQTLALLSQQRWERRWRAMIPVTVDGTDAMLFRASGRDAELHAFSSAGQFSSLATFELDRDWQTIISGRFRRGSRDLDVLGYDADRGVATFYRVERDGLVAETDHLDWRRGWNLLVAARVSESSADPDGIVFYDDTFQDNEIRLEYATFRWGAVARIETRGEYREAQCGGLDFELDANVTFSISPLDGQLAIAVDVEDPDLDFWDGAQAVFCKGLAYPFGFVLGILSVVLGFAEALAERFAPPLDAEAQDRIDAAIGKLPKIDFNVGGARLIGSELTQSADGLLIRGRAQITVPQPPRLEIEPSPDAAGRYVVYESPTSACRGDGSPIEGIRFRIDNNGRGQAFICSIDIDPPNTGFTIESARWRTDSIGVSADGTQVTQLPVRLEQFNPQIELALRYDGEYGADRDVNVRIVSNDPEQPLVELPVRLLSGGSPTFELEPRRGLVIREATHVEEGTVREVVECRVIARRVEREAGGGRLEIRNTSDRPLYVCDIELFGVPDGEAGVLAVRSLPLLIRPHETGTIVVEFNPQRKEHHYRATLRARTNAVAADAAPDIEVAVDALLPHPAMTTSEPIGIEPSDSLVEIIANLPSDVLCVPPNADMCRAHAKFEPIPPDDIAIAMVAVRPVDGELVLRARNGDVIVRDFSEHPERFATVRFIPDPGGPVPPSNPCIADFVGPRAGVRISLEGRRLVRTGRLELVREPRAVASLPGREVVADGDGLHVFDWTDDGQPQRMAATELNGPVAVAVLGVEHVLASVGDELVTCGIGEAQPLARHSARSRVRALAAARGRVVALEEDRLTTFSYEHRELRPAGELPLRGAIDVGLFRGGAYVLEAERLVLLRIGDDAKPAIVDEVAIGRPSRLSHYGRTILVTDADASHAFTVRGDRLVPYADYHGGHIGADFVPDRAHERLFKLDAHGLEVWRVVPHRLARDATQTSA